jgi:WD40 repeat protein
MSTLCIGRYVHGWHIRIVVTMMLVLILVVGCRRAELTEIAALPTTTATPIPPTALGPAAITADTVDQVELIHTLKGHTDRVYGLDFSSDGRWLASGSWDGTIRVWDVASRQEMQAFDGHGDWDVFFAPDDEHVASVYGAIWNIASGEKVKSLNAGDFHVTFSPDGDWMASAGYNTPIELWDVETWQVAQTFEGHTDRVFGIAFSPDSTRLASGSGMGPSDVSDFTVRLWDVESGRERHVLQGHRGDVHAVAFSPDGTLIASASIDYTVRLWDVQSGEVVHTLNHRDGLWDVAFSPDGELLASAGVERQVRLWDVASGRSLRSLRHDDEVMAVAFSPDGTLLASGGYDNQVRLWGIPR